MSPSTIKLPEPPLLVAGGVGGPAIYMFITPCRNALTLGAQDTTSNVRQIYQQVFSRGIARGWSGGIYPAIVACPQFLTLGPLYHFCEKGMGMPQLPAVAFCSAAETMIAYGAETKNAHLAMNVKKAGTIPKVHNAMLPYGPGVGIHFMRNLVVTCGLRLFNQPIISNLTKVNESLAARYQCGVNHGFGSTKKGVVSQDAVNLVGDTCGNILSACLTMPLHQMYGFVVTSPHIWNVGMIEKRDALIEFLRKQYFVNGSLSRVLARDLCLRSLYTAGVYTMFSTTERLLVKYWPGQKR